MNRMVIAGLAFGGWLLARQAAAAAENKISIVEAGMMINRVNADLGGILDPLDVLAVIEIESGFRPDAYRYEKHLDDASIGLMQILFTTAQDRGLVQGPAALFDPETNICYGMRQLVWSRRFLANELGRQPTMEELIGSYNAGVGNVARKGYIPRAYVEKWAAARRRLEG